ncbi:MAG: glycosyltransferase [Pirellulaceae bacterium]
MPSRLLLLLPVYNDWEAARQLLSTLNDVLKRESVETHVLLVDDGSAVHAFQNDGWYSFSSVDLLRLKRNVGHQRAICIGLSYAEENIPCDYVLVMDSDGEDDPRDVPRLLHACEELGQTKIVFAERRRRSETWLFRVFYFLYRSLHRILVGQDVRVGNFSMIPADRLRGLTVVPELWNHYAAAVIVSRQAYCSIPTQRARRLDGHSKMNFLSLVIHGLSALSVFSDRIAVRVLSALSVLSLLNIAAIFCVVGIRVLTNLAVPGWATYSCGLLLVILLQLVFIGVVFGFVILSGRAGGTFLPARDYVYFVDHAGPASLASQHDRVAIHNE